MFRFPVRKQSTEQPLQVSPYDVVTSFLMSLLLLIGSLVLMLFLVWMTSRWSFPPRLIQAMLEQPEGTTNPEGLDRDFEPPGAEEVEELIEPTLPDTIEALTDSVSTVAGAIAMDTMTAESTRGVHVGDDREPGEDREGDPDIVPRYKRWQLDFSARDLKSYAEQLDYFGIELGVIGGGIQGVDIVNRLAHQPQSRRVEDSESEKRLYFMWGKPGPLMRFDQQLLSQAGVTLQDRRIVHFIPPDLESGTLAPLELQYAHDRGYQSVSQIAKTVFDCRRTKSGFEWQVTGQRYRRVK